MIPGGGTLHIDRITAEDQGLYTCRATNKKGSAESSSYIWVNSKGPLSNSIFKIIIYIIYIYILIFIYTFIYILIYLYIYNVGFLSLYSHGTVNNDKALDCRGDDMWQRFIIFFYQI